jgi:hypothetical protein
MDETQGPKRTHENINRVRVFVERMARLKGCRITKDLEDNVHPGVVLGSYDQTAVLLRLGIPQHRPLSLQSQVVSMVSIEGPSPSFFITPNIEQVGLIRMLAWFVWNERFDSVFIEDDNVRSKSVTTIIDRGRGIDGGIAVGI